MENINGTLLKADTRDTFERTRDAGMQDYTINCTDGGKLKFKIKTRKNGRWTTEVNRSKITEGETLTGQYCVHDSCSKNVKFIFSRNIGTKGVRYTSEV